MNKYLPFIIFALVNAGFLFSAYFYPTMRDEFYYLNKESSVDIFQEYYNAYMHGNPRIGQFFCNMISRNLLMRAVFGLFVFNAFFALLYLCIFRNLPNFKKPSDFVNLSILVAAFVFLINVFGEMFYYTPFSSNYTFLMSFHLLSIFIWSEYFVYNNNILSKRYFSIPLIVVLGIFTGMGNEHIPPVLLIAFFSASVYYLLKFNKLPHYKIITYKIAVVTGYLILFFAPANANKYKVVGKSQGFNIIDYFDSFKNVLNIFRYYHAVLIICLVVAIIISVSIYLKQKSHDQYLSKITAILSLGLLTIPIVAYAPISGTRLLFFSNVMFFLFISFVVLKLNNKVFNRNIWFALSSVFLLLFFFISCIVSFNGNKNFEKVTGEIKEQKKLKDEVILSRSFDYYTPELGIYNRVFFLDQGLDYIDENADKDTSQEMLLKDYYQLKELSVSK